MKREDFQAIIDDLYSQAQAFKTSENDQGHPDNAEIWIDITDSLADIQDLLMALS